MWTQKLPNNPHSPPSQPPPASVGRGLIVLARVALVLGVAWFIWDGYKSHQEKELAKELLGPTASYLRHYNSLN